MGLIEDQRLQLHAALDEGSRADGDAAFEIS
jgi:hypothetical protein